MTADAPALPNRLLPLTTLQLQAVVTVLLAGWADWLFFGHRPGVTFAIFLAVLALSVVVVNYSRVERKRLAKATLVLAASLLPSLENLSYLSAILGMAGIVSFVLIIHRQFRASLMSGLFNAGAFLVRMPARLPFDAHSIVKAGKRRKSMVGQRLSLSVWILPIGFSLIFLLMFSNANPLIEKWFTDIDLSQLTEIFNGYRIMFWCGAVLVCWPFIRFKPLRRLAGIPVAPAAKSIEAETKRHDMFSEPAIFRSLLMFNLLFGLQIVLDTTYLLGGLELPDGMTYAQYAQRGAYTLICTALLAAAFVLIATRPGSRSETSQRVRALVLAWTIQNILLVAFSIQRLGIYIEAYALTYWRVAAFIWMALVLIGLVLIVTKYARAKSNLWLIETNLFALVVVLYATSFVNIASVIADYNVARSIGSDKPWLDAKYLSELGDAAIPAIDHANANRKLLKLYTLRSGRMASMEALIFARNRVAAKVFRDKNNWRLWSLRRYRLQRYLDTAGLTRVPNSSSYYAP